ncbi:hypothetical protein N8645_00460 [bacterium]|nr:hypothetical protein [bacterium]
MENHRSLALKELARKAELFGLHKKSQIPENDREILGSANREKRLLKIDEINILCKRSNCDTLKLVELQNKLPKIIDDAKKSLVTKMPKLTEPGGSLYPKERADACWRDCFHLARISIYGTAAGDTNITDQQGLKAVHELYTMLNVPIDALTICLKELQENCKKIYSDSTEKRDLELLNGCYNHLVEKMESIKQSKIKKSNE